MDSQAYAVGNLEYIDVSVTLSNPDGLKLKRPSIKNWAPPGSPEAKLPPTLSVDVKKIVGSDREDVDIEVGSPGRGRRYKDVRVDLTLKIPITRVERLAAIKKYSETLFTKPEEAASREVGRKAAIVAFLASNYTQNQVGSFEVVVTYTSYGEDYWEGTVSCSPFRLEIEDRGSFFDKAPKFGAEEKVEEK